MRVEQRQMGPLSVVVADALPQGVSPQRGLVLCHGFGAPGTDLVPIANALLQLIPAAAEGWQLLFPAAPVSLASEGYGDGRAWWALNIQKMQQRFAQLKFEEVLRESPPGIDVARAALREAVDAWHTETGLSWDRTILGGFSQGAMISVDLAVDLDRHPAGLVLWSGCPINATVWQQKAPRLSGLRVFQSHGTEDVVLPYLAGRLLTQLLSNSGLAVEFHEFSGGHQIPFPVLQELPAFLKKCLPG
jgi:phospholipase/carboxylesterase